MTSGSANREGSGDILPILVVGLGNRLLGDDAAGLKILDNLTQNGLGQDPLVEFVDGGTLGIALLGYFSNRKAIVILDAISRGSPSGTVHVLIGEQILKLDGTDRTGTAHGGNAADILRAAVLTGEIPEDTVAVGIEPECLETRLELSESVQHALAEATSTAQAILETLASRWRECG